MCLLDVHFETQDSPRHATAPWAPVSCPHGRTPVLFPIGWQWDSGVGSQEEPGGPQPPGQFWVPGMRASLAWGGGALLGGAGLHSPAALTPARRPPCDQHPRGAEPHDHKVAFS